MTKHALCIGINDYPGTDNDLAGCINDASDWAAALGARGFQVTKLFDKAATKKAMVAAIKELLHGTAAGSTCVITYSGHGTWVPDESADEGDHRDEALCPHDIDTVGPLIDDEIHALFDDRAAGSRLVLFSDSCHSGSVNRGDESDVDPAMPRARYLPPAAWMPKAKLTAAATAAPTAAPSNGLTAAGTDLLFAGCRDRQYSWDTSFGGRPNGAFTYYALKTLQKLPAGSSYQDWFKAIRAYLPSTRCPQTPLLKGLKTVRTSPLFA
jgi:hypothetical protein